MLMAVKAALYLGCLKALRTRLIISMFTIMNLLIIITMQIYIIWI
jgi:hypothetical protein